MVVTYILHRRKNKKQRSPFGVSHPSLIYRDTPFACKWGPLPSLKWSPNNVGEAIHHPQGFLHVLSGDVSHGSPIYCPWRERMTVVCQNPDHHQCSQTHPHRHTPACTRTDPHPHGRTHIRQLNVTTNASLHYMCHRVFCWLRISAVMAYAALPLYGNCCAQPWHGWQQNGHPRYLSCQGQHSWTKRHEKMCVIICQWKAGRETNGNKVFALGFLTHSEHCFILRSNPQHWCAMTLEVPSFDVSFLYIPLTLSQLHTHTTLAYKHIYTHYIYQTNMPPTRILCVNIRSFITDITVMLYLFFWQGQCQVPRFIFTLPSSSST